MSQRYISTPDRTEHLIDDRKRNFNTLDWAYKNTVSGTLIY